MDNLIIENKFMFSKIDFIDEIKVVKKVENDVSYYYFDFALNDLPVHEIEFKFNEYINDSTYSFKPCFLTNNRYRPNWDYGNAIEARFSFCAPIFALLNNNNQAILNVSCSDCYNMVKMHIGVVEETTNPIVIIRLFNEFTSLNKNYSFVLRVDRKNKDFSMSIKEARDFLYSINKINIDIPQEAYDMVYSTWYNFHQNLNQDTLIEELKIASKYGLKSIIIDDGWQTDNSNRGYSYCGDWVVSKNRFYDFKKFVVDAHKLNIKVILWLAVPFIGIHSNNYKKFEGLYLGKLSNDTMIIDPRYPKCRDFMIDIYTRLLKEYDIDGFKFDFIDSFRLNETSIFNDKMDTKSLEIALDNLFSKAKEKLNEIKKNILIEYRQNYTCPNLLKNANMIRVGDCPLDYITNYNEIINLRLTTKVAVHSDMVIFNKNDSLDYKAYNIFATLLGVPQYSFILNDLTKDEKQLLKFFAKYHEHNKKILFNDSLTVTGAPLNYQSAKVFNKQKEILVMYANDILKIKYKRVDVIKMFAENTIYIDADKTYELKIINALGKVIDNLIIKQGIHKISVLPFALLQFKEIK